MKLSRFVWTVFKKLEAFFEDFKVINTGFIYFSLRRYVEISILIRIVKIDF
jgi:hypothetical protein